MEHKLRLAHYIVQQFHGELAAGQAEAQFAGVFRAGELPEDVPEYPVALNGSPRELDIVELLHAAGLASSRAEARRLVQQGAVECEGARVTGLRWTVRSGATLRIGKHRFLKIVDSASKQKGG
jgi:tyrosyl-tRNA synthetase